MGGNAARITAADFVTPPELRDYQLAANGAGRIGGVRLGLAASPRGTQLASSYQQVPLRVLPLDCGPDHPVLIYLLNPTAGLLDGDGHLVELHAGAGTRAVLAGQAATRVHPCLDSYAAQRWTVRVEAGAVLAVLPGPLIPFHGSRYAQHIEIDLADGAGLVWGDIWFAGRYARGAASEEFRFDTMVQSLTIRRAGRLIFRDRFAWRGPWDASTAAWHFGEFPACAAVFCTGHVPRESSARVSRGACMHTSAGDTCWRWIGAAQEVTVAAVATALTAAGNLAGDKPWLLTGHELGPNHWFSVEQPSGERPVRSSIGR